jgi:hypothetical protein
MHMFSVTKHQYGLCLAGTLFLAMTALPKPIPEFAVVRPGQAERSGPFLD